MASRLTDLGYRTICVLLAESVPVPPFPECSLCCILTLVSSAGLCGSGHLQADRSASAAFCRTVTAQLMMWSMLLARLCTGSADLGAEPADMIRQQ